MISSKQLLLGIYKYIWAHRNSCGAARAHTLVVLPVLIIAWLPLVAALTFAGKASNSHLVQTSRV